MNRRLGLLFGFCLFLVCIRGQNLQRYAFEEPHMGTQFRIILYAEDSAKAHSAVRAAFDRVEALNTCMSDYLPDSELNLLCKKSGNGEWIKVSKDLWNVLSASQSYAKKSKGAFDVTVGPLSRLWRRAMRKASFPETDKLAKARSLVGYKYMKLSKRKQSVRLKKKDMRLDLGGIAKGYTIDEVLKVLYSFGIRRVLVDGGGDIILGDPPVDAEGWSIQIPQSSYSLDEKTEIIFLSNCAIATSGDTYRYIELEGVRYSHIIDPRTGLGLTQRRMYTVLANTAMTADALASTLSVQGRQSRKKIRKKYKDNRIQPIYIDW